jgi:tryptophanyl-tRNA synthetase
MGIENVKDILALGFNMEKTFIFLAKLIMNFKFYHFTQYSKKIKIIILMS